LILTIEIESLIFRVLDQDQIGDHVALWK